jgi:DNA (cytosine-5)-methyltransferase 1
VLTGGYPCQPFSHAGMRKGTDDDRHLWPHVLRAIREMGPQLAILENVRGHISLGFDVVLSDLASVGWSARWGVIRASDAGAPHQRARLFIVAYPDRGRRQQRDQGKRHVYVTDSDGERVFTDADDSGRREHGGPVADATQHLATQCGRVPASHACGQRHGRGQDPRVVGRVGTPSDVIGRQASAAREVASNRGAQGFHWGEYGPAIARWEHVIGRPAPAPTEPRADGVHRLSPRFTEWMMGLPDGHVTDPAIGISRTDQLKALGNGVVPQQAALALDVLLKGTPYDIRQGLATV